MGYWNLYEILKMFAQLLMFSITLERPIKIIIFFVVNITCQTNICDEWFHWLLYSAFYVVMFLTLWLTLHPIVYHVFTVLNKVCISHLKNECFKYWYTHTALLVLQKSNTHPVALLHLIVVLLLVNLSYLSLNENLRYFMAYFKK